VNIVVEGISFDVEYGYQPKEAETLTYPGCDESITINSIIYKHVDVIDLMSEDWKGLIQEKIMDECL